MHKNKSFSSLSRGSFKDRAVTEYYKLDVDDGAAYVKMNPPQRKIYQHVWCKVLIGLCISGSILAVLLMIVVVVTWFSVAGVLWNVVFAVDPKKNCEPFRGNRPSNYTIQANCPYFVEPAGQWHDKLKGYFVEEEHYETVNFMSRDADWIKGGIGKVKIVGTLYTQPIINSTSRFIVTVHGYTACRYRYETMVASTMLYKMGFNVLQIDLRNHGDTGIFEKIPFASFGSFEHLDALGAIDYLQEKYPFLESNSFGIFGTSMGGATSLIAFAKDKRIKQAFVDSPPIDIFETIFFGARDLIGETGAKVAVAALESVISFKSPLMGFPPFHNDPQQLLKSVDLSNGRKIFLMHVEGDLIVPSLNYHAFWKAVNTSIVNNNYPTSSVETFFGTIDYPFNDSSRQHCNKHLCYQFLNLDHFHEMLRKFFVPMLQY